MGVWCDGMTSLGAGKIITQVWPEPLRLRAYKKKIAGDGFIDKPWETNVQVWSVVTKCGTSVFLNSFSILPEPVLEALDQVSLTKICLSTSRVLGLKTLPPPGALKFYWHPNVGHLLCAVNMKMIMVLSTLVLRQCCVSFQMPIYLKLGMHVGRFTQYEMAP